MKIGTYHFKDIHRGDVLYECEAGSNYKFEVLTEPEQEGDIWTFNALGEDGREVRYLMNDKYSHYAPRIYDHEEYA